MLRPLTIASLLDVYMKEADEDYRHSVYSNTVR